jgi:hypothetical protein
VSGTNPPLPASKPVMIRMAMLLVPLSVLTAACGSSGPAARGAGTTTATTTTQVATVPTTSTTAAATTTTARGSSTTTSEPTTTVAPPPPAGTGAYGSVLASPTCPVERVGQPCPPQPVAAEVDGRDANGRTVATTHTDTAGHYRLALAPGSYILVAVTGSMFPRCPATPVTVTPGPAVRQDINCDTGIR